MVGLRDAETFRAKFIEMQQTIINALESGIAAREAQGAQLDRIRALEAEVARLRAWDAEKRRYELKRVGQGTVAYVLKPEARRHAAPNRRIGCAQTAFENGQKSFFQHTVRGVSRCVGCDAVVEIFSLDKWLD